LAGSVTFKESCTLKHQANLGEDVEEVEFEAGEEISLLQDWERSCLVKSNDGKLFNVRKDLLEKAG
jgi:hypothetical protein